METFEYDGVTYGFAVVRCQCADIPCAHPPPVPVFVVAPDEESKWRARAMAAIKAGTRVPARLDLRVPAGSGA